MSDTFFGRKAKRAIKFGINDCKIVSIKEITDRAKNDYSFSFELGFKDTTFTRELRHTFTFTRDKHGNIDPDCKQVQRFYTRFVDYLGLKVPIGLNEKGKIVHADGREVKDVAGLLATQVRLDDLSYKCWIEPNEYEGKVYQAVRFLADATNQEIMKEFEGFVKYIESRSLQTQTAHKTESESSDLPPEPDEE